jgi:hypothetical protein
VLAQAEEQIRDLVVGDEVVVVDVPGEDHIPGARSSTIRTSASWYSKPTHSPTRRSREFRSMYR